MRLSGRESRLAIVIIDEAIYVMRSDYSHVPGTCISLALKIEKFRSIGIGIYFRRVLRLVFLDR